MSRRNALKHGLTASPAAGVAENAARFERLLVEVSRAILPRNAIEASLAHRIATAIWRLQRATRIDAAITEQAASEERTPSGDVDYWIDRIIGRWQHEVRELPETDADLRKAGKKTRFVGLRPGMQGLMEFREKIMWNGAAITAMISLIKSHMHQLSQRWMFCAERCEQLSILLGDRCEFTVSEKYTYPDVYPGATEIQKLIGAARQRAPGEPLPHKLEEIVRTRLKVLDHRRVSCEDPWFEETYTRRKTTAMLPDEPTLERLIRYESHNDRALSRALDTLAKLRGVRVERIAASISGSMPGGGEYQMTGERTEVQTIGAEQGR